MTTALPEIPVTDVFIVQLQLVAPQQPAETRLAVRPGLKLPQGVTLVSPNGPHGPLARCLIGAPGDMTLQGGALVPTEVRADGTIFFDHPLGLWSIPSAETLQVAIPVRGTAAQVAMVEGFVEFAQLSDADPRLEPKTELQVFIAA